MLQGVARLVALPASQSRPPRSDGQDRTTVLIHYAIGSTAQTLRVGQHPTHSLQGSGTFCVHSS